MPYRPLDAERRKRNDGRGRCSVRKRLTAGFLTALALAIGLTVGRVSWPVLLAQTASLQIRVQDLLTGKPVDLDLAACPSPIPGPAGPQGPPGPAGVAGPIGLTGPAGRDGVNGAQGLQGIQGIQGIPGAKGATGSAGAPGPPGRDGVDGKDGAPGPQGPQGTQGPPGPAGPPGWSLTASESAPVNVFVRTTVSPQVLIVNPGGGKVLALRAFLFLGSSDAGVRLRMVACATSTCASYRILTFAYPVSRLAALTWGFQKLKPNESLGTLADKDGETLTVTPDYSVE